MKKLHLLQRLVCAAAMVCLTVPAVAQSVTITPESGHLICALTRDTETGYASGGSAVWRHNQLGLTMICSDRTTASQEGIVTDLGNNLYEMSATSFQLVGGSVCQSYLQIFLPEGYRFTSYSIDVQNNIPEDYNDTEWCSHSKPYYFGETTDAKDLTNAFHYNDVYPVLSLGQYTSDKTYRLSRTSTGAGDMGNVLCFKLATNNTNNEYSGIYMAVTLSNISITFTTEEPDAVGTLAEFDEDIDKGVSCTTFPFYTGRLDLGPIKARTKTTTTTGAYQGQSNRLSFVASNIQDIYGDMIFYEDSCVDRSLPIAERDTMTADGHKSITTARYKNQYYYNLAYGDGMTYYLETPMTKKMTFDLDDDGTKETEVNQGLRYRLTGGTVYYGGKVGSTEVVAIVDTVESRNGDITTYYMAVNDNGEVYNTTTPTYWYHKDTGKMYTNSPNGTRYYAMVEETRETEQTSDDTYYYFTHKATLTPGVTQDRNIASRFTIDSDKNRIVYTCYDSTYVYDYTEEGWGWFSHITLGDYLDLTISPTDYYLDYGTYTYTYEETTFGRTETRTGTKTGYNFQSEPEGYYCWAVRTYDNDGVDLAPYRLIVYDKDGTGELLNTVVESGAEVQSFDLPKGNVADRSMEFNNDAIKIRIEPIDDYDYDGEQTALFYIAPIIEAISPYIDIMDIKLKAVNPDITDFVSATYNAEDFNLGGGSVTFPIPSTLYKEDVVLSCDNLHTKMTDQTYWNGEYKQHGRNNFVMSDYFMHFGDEGTGHNNNIYNDPEYAMNSNYEDKVHVEKVGNIPFEFNNSVYVSDVEMGADETINTVFTENRFTVENYEASKATVKGVELTGKFEEKQFNFDGVTDYYDTVYVFTADEPRYNIAPTGAIQHRFYAYYKMAVKLTQMTYDPIAVVDTIYPTTFYHRNGYTDPMYGITFYAWEDPEHTTLGYITDSQAYAALANVLKDSINHPELKKGSQILYFDYSKLKGVVTTQEGSWDKIVQYANPNCLTFLPYGNDHQANNFARKESREDGSVFFQATNNIVLTDLQPFFSPYEIQIAEENYVRYERLLAGKNTRKNQTQTVSLPFRLVLKNNEFISDPTVDNSGSRFSLWTMEAGAKIEDPSMELGYDYTNDVKFINIGRIPSADSDVKEYIDTVYANRCYTVKLDSAFFANNNLADSICFVIVQRGGTVVPSRVAKLGYNIPDYDDPTTYTWHRGLEYFPYWESDATLNGLQYKFTGCATYSGTQVENCFYYNKNRFVCTANLAAGKQYANIRPFRGFVSYETSGTPAREFGLLFETVYTEEDNPETTGIIRPTTDSAQTVIYDLQGRRVEKMQRGINIVNGKKVVF